jgi:hypothetical protein
MVWLVVGSRKLVPGKRDTGAVAFSPVSLFPFPF